MSELPGGEGCWLGVLGGGGYCDPILDTPCNGGESTTDIGVKRFGSYWFGIVLKEEGICESISLPLSSDIVERNKKIVYSMQKNNLQMRRRIGRGS